MSILIDPSAFQLPQGPLVAGDIVSYNSYLSDRVWQEEARYLVVSFAGKVPAANSSQKIANFTYMSILLAKSSSSWGFSMASGRVGQKGMIVIPERSSRLTSREHYTRAFAFTATNGAWVLEQRI